MSEELSKNFETLQLHAGYVCLGSDHGVLFHIEAIYTAVQLQLSNTMSGATPYGSQFD